MERRLAVISSHLRPIPPLRPSAASASPCSSSGGESQVDGESGRDGGSRSSSGGGRCCVFCRIVRGESPAFKLYEDDVCMCILDSNPLNAGHSLIIPKKHFSSLEETPPLIVAAMCSTVPVLSKAIMNATESDGFNLLVNNGAAAGQVVFHTHLHIIPRREDDKLWRSDAVKRKRLKLNQGTPALAHRIREELSSPAKVGVFCETQATKISENS